MVIPVAVFLTGLLAIVAGYFYLREGEEPATRRRIGTGRPDRPIGPAPTLDLKAEQGRRLARYDVLATADDLPTLAEGHRAPGWWGMAMLILIETLVFITLITSYFYLRAGASTWPPDRIEPPSLLLPCINTLILIASVAPIRRATQGMRKGDRRAFLIWLPVGVVMGLIFLTIKGIEYSQQSSTWYTNAYGSIVWTMTGFHVAHVIVLLAKSATIWFVGWQGYFNKRRHAAVEGNALYWYFVVTIWLPLFLTIYIAPYLI